MMPTVRNGESGVAVSMTFPVCKGRFSGVLVCTDQFNFSTKFIENSAMLVFPALSFK